MTTMTKARRPRRAHFRVTGRFDSASRMQRGKFTVSETLDALGREGPTFVVVRVHKKRSTYTMLLDDVAQIIVERAIRERVRAERAFKKAARATRRLTRLS